MKRIMTTCLMACFLTGCAGMDVSVRYPAPVPPPASAPVHREAGIASFYAMKYQNRLTANGERFDQYARTAAHKTLPFGTWVRVINVSNGRSVMVRINDRGPFIKGRIIDLSRSAFSSIADPRLGIVDVVIEVVNGDVSLF